MGYHFDFSSFAQYKAALLAGLAVTLLLAATSSVLGTIAGILIGWLLRIRFIGPLLVVLNDLFRGVPALVWMLFFYAFPYRQVLHMDTLPSEFTCASLGLMLSQAVFTAELFRSALGSVSPKPLTSAHGLGMSRWCMFRWIVLPDVARQMIAPLWAFFIGNIKLSSFASYIGVREVLFYAEAATSQNHRTFESWIIVAIIYMVLVLPFAIVGRRLENSIWIRRRG